MLPLLGVNIDHVATIREARQVNYPDPVTAAAIAEMAGADQITVHLRGDRRHIQERDIAILVNTIQTRLNVEVAPTDEMMVIVCDLLPTQVTLVPEREGEVTTEGGLDLSVAATRKATAAALERLQAVGIGGSIFADPDPAQVKAVLELGAAAIELNTAAFAEAESEEEADKQLERIRAAAQAANRGGLYVAAGHGLHYHNVAALADLQLIEEYNIGHAIVARALFAGLDNAIRHMKALLA
jgi:pyridoxine 5-phosphate synthase